MKASWNPRSTRIKNISMDLPTVQKDARETNGKNVKFSVFFLQIPNIVFFKIALCPFYGTDIEFVGLFGTTIITGF